MERDNQEEQGAKHALPTAGLGPVVVGEPEGAIEDKDPVQAPPTTGLGPGEGEKMVGLVENEKNPPDTGAQNPPKKMKEKSKIPYGLRVKLFADPGQNGTHTKLTQRATGSKRKGIVTGAEMMKYMSGKDQKKEIFNPADPEDRASIVETSLSLTSSENFEEKGRKTTPGEDKAKPSLTNLGIREDKEKPKDQKAGSPLRSDHQRECLNRSNAGKDASFHTDGCKFWTNNPNPEEDYKAEVSRTKLEDLVLPKTNQP